MDVTGKSDEFKRGVITALLWAANPETAPMSCIFLEQAAKRVQETLSEKPEAE